MALQDPKTFGALVRRGKAVDWLLHPTLTTMMAAVLAVVIGSAAVYFEALASWSSEAQQIALLVQSAHMEDPRGLRADTQTLKLSRYVVVRSTLVVNTPAQDPDTCAARLAERLGSLLDGPPGSVNEPSPLADVEAVVGVCGRGETATHIATDIPRLVILRPHFDAGGHHVATEITIVETSPRPSILEAVGRPSVIVAILGVALCVALVVWYWSRTTHRRMADLWAAAAVDGLSGALRHEAFVAWLSGAIAEARRSAAPLAVLAVDIDNLKALNDSLGHAGGDAAIRLVATAIQQALGPDGVVGRLGGDEFGALLVGERLDKATATAETIRRAIEAASITNHGKTAGTTVSIGVAALKAGDDAATLVQRADGALYDAKGTSRNRVITAP